MTKNAFFTKVVGWLQTTEMFERPFKKIPGEWHLFEYYRDEKDELLHFTEDLLKEKLLSAEMRFVNTGTFSLKSNLPIPLFQNKTEGDWSVTKNFITLIDPNTFRNNIEMQFAFEKGNLKLLKKDAFGKIEFFGFFRKINA
jgi:hypothetical protein